MTSSEVAFEHDGRGLLCLAGRAHQAGSQSWVREIERNGPAEAIVEPRWTHWPPLSRDGPRGDDLRDARLELASGRRRSPPGRGGCRVHPRGVEHNLGRLQPAVRPHVGSSWPRAQRLAAMALRLNCAETGSATILEVARGAAESDSTVTPFTGRRQRKTLFSTE